jgi:hypothetical protein
VSPEDERELRLCSYAQTVTLPGSLLREVLDEIGAIRERLALRDVCEVCCDVLVTQPSRCERHAHAQRGDPEWTEEP